MVHSGHCDSVQLLLVEIGDDVPRRGEGDVAALLPQEKYAVAPRISVPLVVWDRAPGHASHPLAAFVRVLDPDVLHLCTGGWGGQRRKGREERIQCSMHVSIIMHIYVVIHYIYTYMYMLRTCIYNYVHVGACPQIYTYTCMLHHNRIARSASNRHFKKVSDLTVTRLWIADPGT